MKFNKKGFLGPIGDDLPSLMPLLFAMVMFFSTFTYAFQVFESRNMAFNDDISMLKIAATLKSNGYIENAEAFSKRCLVIGPSDLKYVAVVTNAATAPAMFGDANPGVNPALGINLYDLRPFKVGGTTELLCTNLDSADRPIPIPRIFGKNINVKVYPIAVEDEKVVKPMHLILAAWRG